MPKMRRGDEVVIRRGDAPGTADPVRMARAAGAYKGDIGGCKGIVLGTEVGSDGIEKTVVAPTDYSNDGKPTGLLDVPTDRLRHTGFRRVPEDIARAARGVSRIFSRGVGPGRRGRSVRERTRYDRATKSLVTEPVE